MPTTFDPAIGNATRWKRGGPSPNPGGRPKSRLLSQALSSRLAEIKPDDPKGRTYAEVVAANLIEIACSGWAWGGDSSQRDSKNAMRQDALQTIFSGRIDIFYSQNLR